MDVGTFACIGDRGCPAHAGVASCDERLPASQPPRSPVARLAVVWSRFHFAGQTRPRLRLFPVGRLGIFVSRVLQSSLVHRFTHMRGGVSQRCRSVQCRGAGCSDDRSSRDRGFSADGHSTTPLVTQNNRHGRLSFRRSREELRIAGGPLDLGASMPLDSFRFLLVELVNSDLACRSTRNISFRPAWRAEPVNPVCSFFENKQGHDPHC